MFKCFGCLFQMIFPDDSFGLLFQMIISDDYFGCLFQITLPDDPFGLVFQMTTSHASFRWLLDDCLDLYCLDCCLFRMAILDGYSAWICSSEEVKWKRGLDHLLFNRRLRSSTAPWNLKQLLRNSMTDSYFSDQFVFSDFSDRFRFARPIYISTNQFVFERRFPTAELWPQSPLMSNSD